MHLWNPFADTFNYPAGAYSSASSLLSWPALEPGSLLRRARIKRMYLYPSILHFMAKAKQLLTKLIQCMAQHLNPLVRQLLHYVGYDLWPSPSSLADVLIVHHSYHLSCSASPSYPTEKE